LRTSRSCAIGAAFDDFFGVSVADAGEFLSWSSVAELRSTKPDFGALEAADFDFDCDVVELAVACALVIATDKVRIQAKTNTNARVDAFFA